MPAGLIVVEPGFWSTIQDSGRTGYREWGVPVGGAFDRGSADLANAQVGNDPTFAVLELTMLGGTYEATCNFGIALAGATMEASILGTESGKRPLRIPLSIALKAGERLVLGRTLQGARSYLAVKGGFQTPLRLGSRSSEQPVRRGELLPCEESTVATRHPCDPEWISPTSSPLRIIAGPEGSSLIAAGFWIPSDFRVGSQSNRIGLRLEGPPAEISSEPDRLSAPVAPGAIQVAGGQLIVLGVAGGTMGGYPHVAHVISPDLDRLAQLRPGDRIRFQHVSLAEARSLDGERRLALRSLHIRLASFAGDFSPRVG
jgi:biotin-dependent carboxylase-like uncharacterized protein